MFTMMTREMESYEGFRSRLKISAIAKTMVSIAMISSALVLLEVLL
jgi:hypothetical protein